MFKDYEIYKYFKSKLHKPSELGVENNEKCKDSYIRDYSNPSNGNVWFLIYYYDTKEIFNKFECEIFDIVEDCDLEEYIKVDRYFINNLVWLIYEVMAEELLTDLWEEDYGKD